MYMYQGKQAVITVAFPDGQTLKLKVRDCRVTVKDILSSTDSGVSVHGFPVVFLKEAECRVDLTGRVDWSRKIDHLFFEQKDISKPQTRSWSGHNPRKVEKRQL